jgi:hypothetical protein
MKISETREIISDGVTSWRLAYHDRQIRHDLRVPSLQNHRCTPVATLLPVATIVATDRRRAALTTKVNEGSVSSVSGIGFVCVVSPSLNTTTLLQI